MLKLCKDGEFVDVVLDGKRIASWGSDKGACHFLSPDAVSIVAEDGEVDAIIIPADEYEYFKDVEEMLIAMQAVLRERTE